MKFDIHHIISIGTSCFTANWLRRQNLRRSAYPFDWTFSHPQMIINCLHTQFTNYLNPIYYQETTNNQNCRHTLYDTTVPIFAVFNPPTFFHHNPLKLQDHQYLQRCVNRFVNILKTSDNKLFLMTFVNQKQHLDSNQIQSLLDLKITLDSQTSNAFVVIINCLYLPQSSHVDRIQFLADKLVMIDLVTSEIVGGTNFTDPHDWDLYQSQLDQYYNFNLRPSPELTIEKDPW